MSEVPTPTEEIIYRAFGGEIKITTITYIGIGIVCFLVIMLLIWKICPPTLCRTQDESSDVVIDLDNDPESLEKANLQDDLKLNVEAP